MHKYIYNIYIHNINPIYSFVTQFNKSVTCYLYEKIFFSFCKILFFLLFRYFERLFSNKIISITSSLKLTQTSHFMGVCLNPTVRPKKCIFDQVGKVMQANLLRIWPLMSWSDRYNCLSTSMNVIQPIQN